MNIAFFGAPDFAADYLRQLHAEVPITVVFTQPDQPAGRNQKLTPTPVKQYAYSISLPTVEETSTEKIIEKLQEYKVDLAILFAYGKLLASEVLKTPKLGFLNVHPSLLPKYRGVAPMAFALMNGEKETGVSLIQLDNEMDHGPVIAQEKVAIDPDDRRPELEKKLSSLASQMTARIIPNIVRDLERSSAQDHSQATFTRFLTKKDGFIPWETLQEFPNNSREAEKIYNLYRGLFPWPGIWTKVMIKGQEKRLKITEMKKDQLVKVQLEGKTQVPYSQFLEAYTLNNNPIK